MSNYIQQQKPISEKENLTCTFKHTFCRRYIFYILIVGNKIKVTSHKPDSVVGYHLSVAAVTRSNQSAYPSALGRAAPPVYMAFQHTRFTRKTYYYAMPWALTSRFHPYPPKADGNFLWHSLLFAPLNKFGITNIRLFTGVLPFAVRTFLGA